MDEPVTLLRRRPGSTDPQPSTEDLPADLLEQIRRRVGLLALLLLVAFSIDVVLAIVLWVARLSGLKAAAGVETPIGITLVNTIAVVASAALRIVSRRERFSAAALRRLGFAYEVFVCLAIGLLAHWQAFRDHGRLAELTWVPAIIVFFPLILPASPRTTLVVAFVSSLTTPLAVAVLAAAGRVSAGPGAIFDATLPGLLAIGAAYAGARVVHGLGKAVAAARELGSYRLERELGRGGMGEVWVARHRLLARPAAIKIIRSRPGGGQGEASPEARRRFEREAQAIAALRSPHTVNLFDFGVADDGSFYYAMELLEGFDVQALVQRFGPIPEERVIHVLRQACHSLSEAAACGLVHRDVKPANMFLCRYGEDVDFVKVLDFGLVKALDEPDEREPALTRENAVHGTPAFMAPEQALGRPLDARADVYGLGCVAYWLLTGCLVFEGETTMALVHHHIATPAAPPSTRGELHISEAVDRLVLACLAKDPAERPQSARELAARLEAIEVPKPWTRERALAWWEANVFSAG